MKYLFIILVFTFKLSVSGQQKQTAMPAPKPTALPTLLYAGLRDSCTSLDITFFSSSASMSLDNRNVKFFAAFVSPMPAQKKSELKQDGIIMWQKDGREYITGSMYFSGDSTGYLTFNKNNREYINAFTPQGAAFLQTHGKKK